MVVAGFLLWWWLWFLFNGGGYFFFLMVLARFFIRCGGWVCVNDGSWDFTLFVLF